MTSVKFASGVAAAALLLIVSAPGIASATTTIDIYDHNGYFSTLSAYFTGQGYTVNQITNFSAISGANLVIVNEPSQFFIPAQKALISSYVSSGGRLIVNGDVVAAGVAGYVNDLLLASGSTMLDSAPDYDSGFHTTTDITVNSFTTGVHTIDYAATTKIINGTSLVRGASGQTFVSYEAVGAGYVFAIADADGASPGVFTAHDNAKLYCNFGNLSCAAPGGGAPGAPGGVPEPAAWALMLIGFGGVGAVLRRRRLVAAA